jgi:hypothetical protein
MKSKKNTMWVALSVLLIAAVVLSACARRRADPGEDHRNQRSGSDQEVPKKLWSPRKCSAATAAPAYEAPGLREPVAYDPDRYRDLFRRRVDAQVQCPAS